MQSGFPGSVCLVGAWEKATVAVSRGISMGSTRDEVGEPAEGILLQNCG